MKKIFLICTLTLCISFCFSSCTPNDIKKSINAVKSWGEPKVSLSNFRVNRNIELEDGFCAAFQFTMDVENAKGHQLEPHLYLYTDEQDTPHRMIDGNAFEHVGMIMNPLEDNTSWDTMSILVPYKKLNLKKGENHYYARLKIYDTTDSKWINSTGGYVHFNMKDVTKKRVAKKSSSKKKTVSSGSASSSQQQARSNNSSSSSSSSSSRQSSQPSQVYDHSGPSVMVCPTCAGGGTLPWHNYNTCKTCNGAGVVYW